MSEEKLDAANAIIIEATKLETPNGDNATAKLSQATLDLLNDISSDDSTTDEEVSEQPQVIKIRKPGTEFFQVYPDWRQAVRLYLHKEDGKSGTPYLVTKSLQRHEVFTNIVSGIAVLCVSKKSSTLFFHMFRLPDSVDPHLAHTSMLLAIEEAKTRWIRVSWTSGSGQWRRHIAKDTTPPVWASILPEPVPELFAKSVRESGRFIDSEQHPIILELQGEKSEA